VISGVDRDLAKRHPVARKNYRLDVFDITHFLLVAFALSTSQDKHGTQRTITLVARAAQAQAQAQALNGTCPL
jgi:hypothetical protein